MKCPHCLVAFHVTDGTPGSGLHDTPLGGSRFSSLGVEDGCTWFVERTRCPDCQRHILRIIQIPHSDAQQHGLASAATWLYRNRYARLIYPRASGRPPVPPEVLAEFSEDYTEACLVLADSPKASAALSRRCLQLLLRKKVGAQGKNLYEEVQWAINSAGLPSSITDLLDVPRKIGNNAAHPNLSSVGEIVDVEPWEAEWCLEVIEALYDHLFVVPARNAERLARLGPSSGNSSGTGPIT